jgi:hypothetical protein
MFERFVYLLWIGLTCKSFDDSSFSLLSNMESFSFACCKRELILYAIHSFNSWSCLFELMLLLHLYVGYGSELLCSALWLSCSKNSVSIFMFYHFWNFLEALLFLLSRWVIDFLSSWKDMFGVMFRICNVLRISQNLIRVFLFAGGEFSSSIFSFRK